MQSKAHQAEEDMSVQKPRLPGYGSLYSTHCHGGADVYRRRDIARDLGREAACAVQDLSVVADLMIAGRAGEGIAYPREFGEGMAEAASEIRPVWDALVQAIERHADGKGRGIDLLKAFLDGVCQRDQALFNALLDEAMDWPALRAWIPRLQIRRSRLDHAGCERLLKLVGDESVPVTAFSPLYEVTSFGWSNEQLVKLVVGMSARGEQWWQWLLLMLAHFYEARVYGFSDVNVLPPDEAVREAVVESLLEGMRAGWDCADHNLDDVIHAVLAGEDARADALRFIEGIRCWIELEQPRWEHLGDVIRALGELHPEIVLDVLVEDAADDVAADRRRMLAG